MIKEARNDYLEGVDRIGSQRGLEDMLTVSVGVLKEQLAEAVHDV